MEKIIFRTGAVSNDLWVLLKSLMIEPALSSFYLVGGTALALLLGHRSSEDIDLFCTEHFDSNQLAEILKSLYSIERMYLETNTISAYISGIKTDLMTHSYTLLDKINETEGIRLASLTDIAAMKLNAVSGRGLKKDFWDVAALLDIFSLPQMIGFFREKYPLADDWHLIRSLCYFGDADNDVTPIKDLQNGNWDMVKLKIIEATSCFAKQ